MLPTSDKAIKAIADSKIQAAIEDGEFDDLHGLGEPFEFDDACYDQHWWICRKVERESLKNLFRQTPPPIPASPTNETKE